MVKVEASIAPEKPPRNRMILGACVLVVGQLALAGMPVITALELPDPWDGILKIIVLFVLPDLSLVAAIAIWGKPGWLYLKKKLFAFLKRGLPPDRVGLTRYRIGLVMFTVPIVFAFAEPYASTLSGAALSKPPHAIVGDMIFFASFFVLGGDFWDKVRALFVRNAVATFPPADEAAAG